MHYGPSMKPLPTHPPLTVGRSRPNHRGLPAHAGVNSGTISREWRRQQVEKVGNTPTWMKKLEDRYQRLHKKIAAIPTSSPAGSFNLLTRKFLNQALAKAVVRNCAHREHSDQREDGGLTHDLDNANKSDSEKGDSRGTTGSPGKDMNVAASNISHNNHSLHSPERLSHKGHLLTASRVVSQPVHSSDDPTVSETSRGPTVKTNGRQEKETSGELVKGEKSREVLAPALQGSVPCGCNCHNNGAVSTHPSLPPVLNGSSVEPPCPPPPVGTDSPVARTFLPPLSSPPAGCPSPPCPSGKDGAHTVTHSCCRRRTPVLERCLSERDEAVSGPHSTGPYLAASTGWANLSSAPQTAQHNTARHSCSVQRTGCQVRTVCACGAGSYGLCPAMVSRGHGVATDRADGLGRGQTGGQRHSDGGGRGTAEMGDNFSPAVRTLNSVSAVENKRGSSVRAAQTTVNHHHSTSVPAAVDSTDLTAPAKRHGGGKGEGEAVVQPEADEKSDRGNLQGLPQMSAEARHAICETLKEMGTVSREGKGEQGSDKEVEEGDEDDDSHHTHSVNSLPSLAEPLPTIPLQRSSWHPNDASTTHHQQQQQQQQQSRENSLTASQRTTVTRQKSYRSNRQVDNTSSVNVTARGPKSPRRSNKRPPSFHTSMNARVDPKSEPTLETETDRLHDGAEPRGKMDLDLATAASMGKAASNRSSPEIVQEGVQRMHLPAITSRTEPNLMKSPRTDNIRHVNYRINGVGSYRVARENTFEITAPDFDVRYRDVISCQKGDRETPPPEIYEKSVGKVREWLNKYYSPYSPS